MRDLTEDESNARSIGLALLAASEVYDGFLIPRTEGVLRRRQVPRHTSAVVGLVGRQRRFLRAAYLLADAGMDLEAIGPVRSMFEFFVTQRWLALDPDLNWMLWMERDHRTRDTWRERLGEHVPELSAAAVASLTPEQRAEATDIAEVREQIKLRLGDRKPVVPSMEQQAKDVGLAPWYDILYRYQSNAGLHPSMLATDLLFEATPRGLRLHGEPTERFVSIPAYLLGAHFLHDALKDCGEQMPSLRIPELDELWTGLAAAIIRYWSQNATNRREPVGGQS
jgi:Family of unknown function (DUF5677)